MTTQLAPSSSLAAADMRAVTDASTDLAAELGRVLAGEVLFDGYTRMLYSTDASLFQIMPVGVVVPKHADDVQAAVEIAARHGIPVLPRGAGSSLAGQAVGPALVMDFSKYMDKIGGVDAETRQVRTQPGISVAALNRQIARHGLMLGPDPASGDRATIGGSVGNNATGSHSILYGMMADSVHEISAILADGSRAVFGPQAVENLVALGKSEGLEGRIYRELPQIINKNMQQILERWPKHWRRASGYNLDRLAAALLPPKERGKLSASSPFRPAIADPTRIDRFNIAQLLTGSEGTLAITTEMVMNLVPRPTRTGLAVIPFATLLEACAAITDVLETDPSAAELLDKQLMDLARAQPEWAKKLHFVTGDPEAVLLVEYYGESEAELVTKLAHFEQHMAARGWRGAVTRLLNPAHQADVWSVRKAGLNLLMSRRGDFKPVPGIEDVSVPPERLADYLGEILDYCQQRGDGDIPGVAVYAHASAGCLHVRPLLNVKSQEGVDLLADVSRFAAGLAVKYGGIMSGEHGDGLARTRLNPVIFGPELYGALQEVKGIFDPENRLNPGKIVEPLDTKKPDVFNKPDFWAAAPMRMGPQYQTIKLDTVFDWGTDGGYAPAIEMCNGAGVCRKLDAGTMCPSFQATRDERDSTRGRANALRNALAGRIPAEELFSEGMYDVMDLCLGCKACGTECPSAVDMATIKAEYLVHYYHANGLPWFNRLMGWLPGINRLLFRIAPALIPAVNWGLRLPLAKAIMARIGVAPERTLPAYDRQSFDAWYSMHNAQWTMHNGGSAPIAQSPVPNLPISQSPTPVLFFADTWTNYNETHIGRDMVKLLTAAGYQVLVDNRRECCGRPLITGGQADKARRNVNHNVALLAPYVAQGIPIIGAEPSCILTLRDEYLTLAADKERAKLVAENSFTVEEFVVREMAAGRFAPKWKANPGKALLHGHCHHKALVGNESTVAALKAAGYEVEVIPSGCCGMAGDFGYERDHYAVSRAIGEDRLLPAVRAAAVDTVIVASGTSCRHQIGDFTEREAVHLVEALVLALDTVIVARTGRQDVIRRVAMMGECLMIGALSHSLEQHRCGKRCIWSRRLVLANCLASGAFGGSKPLIPASPALRSMTMKIGLALGGGGARGAAHFGVLKELSRMGIRPDLITGTSVGGLVGAMAAAGHSLEKMTDFFQKLSLTTIYALPNSVPAFSSNAKVERMLEDLFGRITFADLQIPLAVVTTDLVSRKEVILDEGDLVSAIMATTSLPVLLPPVVRDGCALVDGGVLNNTPFDVARARGAHFVIAVDLSNTSPYAIAAEPKSKSGNSGLLDALPIPHTRHTWQVISAINDIISSTSLNARLALHPPDILLQPVIHEVGFFDSTQWKAGMAAGQAAVVAAEEQFIKLQKRLDDSGE